MPAPMTTTDARSGRATMTLLSDTGRYAVLLRIAHRDSLGATQDDSGGVPAQGPPDRRQPRHTHGGRRPREFAGQPCQPIRAETSRAAWRTRVSSSATRGVPNRKVGPDTLREAQIS